LWRRATCEHERDACCRAWVGWGFSHCVLSHTGLTLSNMNLDLAKMQPSACRW
jgi:hypothetical protein